jgi:glutathione S-transferase
MGIITPTNREVVKLKGLHLYHFATSNCSAKVRMCLEEKRLEWTSHHVDLRRNEHLTPEYVGINPKAVVPVLVHDGVVIVESSDIIDYLDQTFPQPPLRPADPAERERMYHWLKLWDETQLSLKTLSHRYLFPWRAEHVRPHLARFEKLARNPELIEFMREFTSETGLSNERVERATEAVQKALAELNARLESNEWLAGNGFSLADLAWSVDIHRFELIKMPMENYRGLVRWYATVASRPSFQRMVLDYEAEFAKAPAPPSGKTAG